MKCVKKMINKDTVLTLTLDVTNLFNAKNKVGSLSDSNEYELGRQFWAGAKYTF